MATFGEALEALEDFRTDLINEQMNVFSPAAQAMAFRASAVMDDPSPLQNVHATGVGVRGNKNDPGKGDFVIKVFVFDKSAVQAAAADPFLGESFGGVEVDVEYLPVQVPFGKVMRAKPATKAVAQAVAQQSRHRPVPGGVEIGPLGGNFVGTLGCFVRRGTGEAAPLFALSNNHVLSDVNRFPIGTRFTQPQSSNASDVIAALSDFEPIHFPSPGSQPRNVMDAAIATVTDQSQVSLGTMLGIANYTPTLLAPRPGMKVTKSGRTTGVTQGTVRAIRVRNVQVNYGTRQNPIIATFDNAITVTGAGGGSFSKPGDSGSVILDTASGRPVALLFAGDATTTTACDIAAVCSWFNVQPV